MLVFDTLKAQTQLIFYEMYLPLCINIFEYIFLNLFLIF